MRLRIDKFANGYVERTAAFRCRFASVFNYRSLFQHGTNTRIGSTPALDDIKHPRQRQHRPNHQAKVHNKAGKLTQGHAALQHHPATATDRQQVGGANRNIDRRVKAGINARHAHIFRPGIRSIGGELRRLPIFKAKGFDHTDAGEALLSTVVQAGECRLRYAKALM